MLSGNVVAGGREWRKSHNLPLFSSVSCRGRRLEKQRKFVFGHGEQARDAALVRSVIRTFFQSDAQQLFSVAFSGPDRCLEKQKRFRVLDRGMRPVEYAAV